ncbi:peroxiredoxin family protein [Schlesneria paludicola]|uniref:peroxiredoxin family protein n=1 Tax=Schlesneria paludicola TaxID=360056 RepID=UPI00029A830C|nr:redoxin domain-containing protein [Schlesneria paludicola]
MNRIVTVVLLTGAVLALVAAVVIPARFGHPVTPAMQQSAITASGRIVSALPDHAPGRPQLVIFILPGCLCSEDYEPFTHALYQAYSSNVDFVGVVDGSEQDAQAWRMVHQTPFPLIADPDCSIADQFDAKRSAYTAVILDGETIHRLWPGYSAQMLNELSELLAAESNVPVALIETSRAPSKLTSGCLLGP